MNRIGIYCFSFCSKVNSNYNYKQILFNKLLKNTFINLSTHSINTSFSDYCNKQTVSEQNKRKLKETFIRSDGKSITSYGNVGDNLLDVVVNNDLDLDGFDSKQNTYETNEDSDYEDINIEMFSQLITSNEVKVEIEKILHQYEYEKYTKTVETPKTLTINYMKGLLNAKDLNQRRMLFNKFYKLEKIQEMRKRAEKEKSDNYWTKKREIYAERNANNIPKTGIFDGNGNIVYGLWHNALFAKFLKNSITKISTNRLRTAAMFGQNLIIDLDFDAVMSETECRALSHQIRDIISFNRYKSVEPYNIQFYNCNSDLPTLKTIHKIMSNINSPIFMSQFNKQSYLELYPTQKLVYITPNSRNIISKYDNSATYILGGHSDKKHHSKISYNKAINEKIANYRLPIDEYILWAKGANNVLGLNIIVSILHDFKISGDLKMSIINNIPKDKQKAVDDVQYEDCIREKSIKKRTKLMNKF